LFSALEGPHIGERSHGFGVRRVVETIDFRLSTHPSTVIYLRLREGRLKVL